MRPALVFIGGFIAAFTAVVMVYRVMAQHSPTEISVVAVAIGFILGLLFGSWSAVRRSMSAFCLAVFCAGCAFLVPFIAATWGYAFVMLPIVVFWTAAAYFGVRLAERMRADDVTSDRD
ncbi:MAG: hypothetical protein ACLGI6_16710 [Gammaproteobacteria bacterium]